MSRPPGVPCNSCSLRFTLVFAVVVSTTGELPVTVTVSATVATLRERSSGTVAPTCTMTFSRMTVRKPCNSTFTEYTPGWSEGKRLTPPPSVTPVIVPATSTGLVRVTLTPGTAPPCASVTRTRIEPVCTWACTGSAATAIKAMAASQIRTRFIVLNLRDSVFAPSIVWMKQSHTTHARPRLSDNDELDCTSADMDLTGAQAWTNATSNRPADGLYT